MNFFGALSPEKVVKPSIKSDLKVSVPLSSASLLNLTDAPGNIRKDLPAFFLFI